VGFDREVAVILTRSIRRKLVLGLGLVLLMLLALSAAGFYGIWSYRDVVNKLDVIINKMPRRSELVESMCHLYDPFHFQSKSLDQIPSENFEEETRYRQIQFKQALDTVRAQVMDFHDKLANLPPHPNMLASKPVTEALLLKLEQGLMELERLLPLLSQQSHTRMIEQQLVNKIAHLQSIALLIPNPPEGTTGTLQHARKVYHGLFQFMLVMSIIVLAILTTLIIFGVRSIFDPIRKLHRGALRVAQGDFQYRIDITSKDEMAELAEAFNKMTTRFQEVTCDLDRQVDERSKQLVRSERLAHVGVLAAGVAHEINNPLSAVTMAAESLQYRLSEMLGDQEGLELEVVQQYLEMIQRESQRCRQITTRLLDFSRGQDTTRREHNLTDLITEVLAMVQHISKYRDREIVFQHATHSYVEVNGNEIKQVILNLVANALESMSAGGKLTISIIDQTDTVILEFQDDGCGMSQEVQQNLFEPFFTQRSDGKGTGLGLSITHRIISDHGGNIAANSDGPGKGSQFTISLPRRAKRRNTAA